MPTVLAYHDVKDTDHWLASPKREEFFGPLGVTNIRTFVDPQNPTRVGLLMDVPDMDAVMAAMETEAAAEAMAHDGVVPETLVLLGLNDPRLLGSAGNRRRSGDIARAVTLNVNGGPDGSCSRDEALVRPDQRWRYRRVWRAPRGGLRRARGNAGTGAE